MYLYSVGRRRGLIGSYLKTVHVLLMDSSGTVQRQSMHHKYCSGTDQEWGELGAVLRQCP